MKKSLWLIFLGISSFVTAQRVVSPLCRQVLFLATDKTLYTNNETIWFAGYLLNDAGIDSLRSDIINVCLVEEQTRKIVLQKKFLLSGGLCAGSLLLPDSIVSGSYDLYAFTNTIDKRNTPAGAYHQHITVKSVRNNSFTATYKIIDSAYTGDSIRIAVQVFSNDITVAAKTIIRYHYPNENVHTLKLNDLGKGLICIPKNDKHVLDVLAEYTDEKQDNDIKLPAKTARKASVEFYPEGGYLVNNTLCNVAWEIKNGGGGSNRVSAFLLKNNHVTDTLRSDDFGVGKFVFIPEAGGEYALKITGSNGDTAAFPLPPAIDQGIAMHVAGAIAGDTLTVEINSAEPQKISFKIFNNRTDSVLISPPVDIVQDKTLKIPLFNVAKGINTITVFNEANKPVAERLFFAHYDRKIDPAIICDSSTYGTRRQVSVTVHIAGRNTGPRRAIFSVACVQRNRLEGGYQKDIESYCYIGRLFDSLSNIVLGTRYYDNKDYLEDILLTRGWRKYLWQSDSTSMVAGQQNDLRRIELTGKVYKNNKPLQQPASLFLLKDASFTEINTDSLGSFTINAVAATVQERKRVFMILNGQTDNPNYKVVMDSTLNRIASEQKNKTPLFDDAEKRVPGDREDLASALKDGLNAHKLKAVTVKATVKDNLFGTANKCGDYVCQYNVLDCPNHPFGPHTLPVKGHLYHAPGGGMIVYSGCYLDDNPGNIYTNFDAVYTAREFYGMDSLTLGQSEQIHMSTIWWQPFIITDASGDAHFSFYTSDARDYYNIVIQGLTQNDFFFKEKTIKVE